MSINKFLAGVLLVFAADVFAFNVSVTNMVGIPAGSTSTVNLPSVIKADSGWVPLFRIIVSTDAATTYYLTRATITLRSIANFDPTVDISNFAIFADTTNPLGALQWNGSSENDTAATYSLTSSGGGVWSYLLTLTDTDSKKIHPGGIGNAFYF
ncbi:MAG: hypothetical protein J7L54_02420, partial [Elusimicrobia bacterium]|nr:hypothetical protein [Elusimicrobiota bacterium]